MTYNFPINPISKPRMTIRDKWKKRPCVLEFFAYRDLIKLQAKKLNFKMPESNFKMTFFLPMPASWSKSKREQMGWTPHKQRPDLDNLMKAFFDCVLEEDCGIWDGKFTKIWSPYPKGMITIEFEPLSMAGRCQQVSSLAPLDKIKG